VVISTQDLQRRWQSWRKEKKYDVAFQNVHVKPLLNFQQKLGMLKQQAVMVLDRRLAKQQKQRMMYECLITQLQEDDR